jgi:hypothetical protein
MLISVDGGDPRLILQAGADKDDHGEVTGLDLYLADPRGPFADPPRLDFKVRHYSGKQARELYLLIRQQSVVYP